MFSKRKSLLALIMSGMLLLLTAATAFAQSTSSSTVNVYFTDYFNSGIYTVNRTTTETTVSGQATYALQQWIVGPTAAEAAQGLTNSLTLDGSSNCGNADFTLSISGNTATFQFCRTVISAGVGQDAAIISQINTTLKQFPTITTVVILTSTGAVFGDQSGKGE